MDELLALPEEPFIRAAYRTFLGRDADESGLRHYLERLLRGDSRASIISALATSPEANTHLSQQVLTQLPDDLFIDAIYHRVLGRPPDGPGKAGYLAALRQHHDRRRIIRDIETSPEARRRNGDSAKLREEFECLLRREGSSSLSAPVDVENLLMKSGESFVNTAYQMILGRDADQDGLRHYLRLLDSGLGKAAVIEVLSSSAEAKRHASEGSLRKSEASAFQRDLKLWLRKQRRTRFWRRISLSTWIERRMNQIEYRLEIIAEHLDTLSTTTYRQGERRTQAVQFEAAHPETQSSNDATGLPRQRPSLFDLLEGLSYDEPSTFISALTERIALSDEALALASVRRDSETPS